MLSILLGILYVLMKLNPHHRRNQKP